MNFNTIDNSLLRHAEAKVYDAPKTKDPAPEYVGIAFARVIDYINDFIKENKYDPNIHKYQKQLWAIEEMHEQVETNGELSMDTEHF